MNSLDNIAGGTRQYDERGLAGSTPVLIANFQVLWHTVIWCLNGLARGSRKNLRGWFPAPQ